MFQQKIQQKEELDNVNEKIIVVKDFSSKSQELNAKKRVNRQISKYKYRITTFKQENLKIKRKNENLRKKIEHSKSHAAPCPLNASRSYDTPNSAELSVAVGSNKKDLKSLR